MKHRKCLGLFAVCLICLTAFAVLTGCNQRPYTKRAVETYAQEQAPGSVLLAVSDNVREDSGKVTSFVRYTFQSPQGMEFHVETFLERSPVFQTMQRRVRDNYEERLLVWKQAFLLDAFQAHGFPWEPDYLPAAWPVVVRIQDFDQIEAASALLLELYQELSPLAPGRDHEIGAVVRPAPMTRNITFFPFKEEYGALYSQEFLQDAMELKYINAAAEGDLQDDLVTEALISSTPREILGLIMVNHGEGVFPVKEKTLLYDLTRGEYVMPLCRASEGELLNSVVELQRDIMAQYYPDAGYAVDEETKTVAYTIRGASYEMSFVGEAGFYKNGEALDIHLIEMPPWVRWNRQACGNDAMRLEDFARMMELELEDIRQNTAYLTSKEAP